MLSDNQREKKIKYLTTDAKVQGHIHAGLRCAPTTKTYKRWFDKRLTELQTARDIALKEWREVEPKYDRKEEIILKAKGHDDNVSVQAARRICAKNNWKY